MRGIKKAQTAAVSNAFILTPKDFSTLNLLELGNRTYPEKQ